MELRDAITARRMARRTTAARVDREFLDGLLDLARRAPTAGNAQGVDLVVVTDEAQRAAIADAAGEPAYVARGFDPWLSTAPVHVVPCADVRRYRDRYAEPDKMGAGPDGWQVPYWWMDLGALLGLPAEVHAAGIVTLGHPHPDGAPTTTSERRPRRDLDDVLHRDRWS